MSDTLQDPRTKGEIARATEEIRRAKEALTVLYEKITEKVEVVGKDIAKLDQRESTSEARLKQLESKVDGNHVSPGLATIVWSIKEELNNIKRFLETWRNNPEEEPPSLSPSTSLPPPPTFVTVHSAWIYIIIPLLFCGVITLAGALLWILSG
jgi:hypothetical protein